jgi:hypothetical protein
VNGGAIQVKSLLATGVSQHHQKARNRQKKNLPNDTVGSFTDYILDIILLADIEGDLARR